MSRYVDIGANLLDASFRGLYRGSRKRKHAPDLDAVLLRAAGAGVRAVIVTASDLDDSRAALQLCRALNSSGRHPRLRLFSTVGVHPLSSRVLDFDGSAIEPMTAPEADDDDAAAAAAAAAATAAAAGAQSPLSPSPPSPSPMSPAARAAPPTDKAAYIEALRAVLRDGCKDGTVVAVGECGLDFEPSRLARASRATQLRHFELHFALAEEFNLPLFLHNRDTGGAFAEIMRARAGQVARSGGGVVHSFDGTADEMRELITLGLHIGFNGCSLRAAASLSAAGQIPLDRLLLETDAPWCSIKASSAAFPSVKTHFEAVAKPEKYIEGKLVRDRCEPCQIVQVAEVVAAVKGRPIEAVTAAAFANSIALFRLPLPSLD